MILISHRGNIDGKNSEKENTVAYITEALDKGYHCEIDVCKFDGKQFYLGHDEPQESVSMSWLRDNTLWCHAKTFNALEAMVAFGIHCFYHKSDDYTITSRGWIWAYPGMPGGKYSIAVHPEKLHPADVNKFAGVCSDHIGKFND